MCRIGKPFGWIPFQVDPTIQCIHGLVNQTLGPLDLSQYLKQIPVQPRKSNGGLRSKRYSFINKEWGIINRKTWLQAHQYCILDSICFAYRSHLLNVEKSIDPIPHMDATQMQTVLSRGGHKQGRLTARITNPKCFPLHLIFPLFSLPRLLLFPSNASSSPGSAEVISSQVQSFHPRSRAL